MRRFPALALVLGLLWSISAQADWIATLPLHITALNTCQERLSYENLTVVDLRPELNEAEIDFRRGGSLYTCLVGVYGGEPRIHEQTTDAPLPDRIFTLLPGYPQHDCYEHKLIHNYHFDPPEAIGWISIRICDEAINPANALVD